MLVGVANVDGLIDRLKRGEFVSEEDVLAESELCSLVICHLMLTLRIQGGRA